MSSPPTVPTSFPQNSPPATPIPNPPPSKMPQLFPPTVPQLSPHTQFPPPPASRPKPYPSEKTSTSPESSSPGQLTVRQRLEKACPRDLSVNGQIFNGSSITYEEYVFSCCIAHKTCDSTGPPDACSLTLIEGLGSKSSALGCGAFEVSSSPWSSSAWRFDWLKRMWIPSPDGETRYSAWLQ